MVSLKSLAIGTQEVSLVCVSLRCVLHRAPFVPMMQAADLRNLHNGTICGRRDRTSNGRIFVQREVRAGPLEQLVEILDILLARLFPQFNRQLDEMAIRLDLMLLLMYLRLCPVQDHVGVNGPLGHVPSSLLPHSRQNRDCRGAGVRHVTDRQYSVSSSTG
jgi:hypothetical protein